jgi:hypothetical protein
MEVRVAIPSPAAAELLYEMNLNGDIYPQGFAIMYLVPDELDRVRSFGLPAEVIKNDLNEFYRNFWLNRDDYHSYEQIIQAMNALAFLHPAICKKYILGYSVEGRELTALKISDNVESDENEPEVMMDGGIHGDEIGGPENLIRFAEDLCAAYGVDEDLTELIDSKEIWLYMMVNPDGREHMTRYNVNGIDLNRDAGYMWDGWGDSPGAFSQVESRVLRNCMYNNQFTIHLTYHSGTEIFLYPWSYRVDAAPDAAYLESIAEIYVNNSGYSDLEYGQACQSLYPVNGSTKDANYGMMGSGTATVEISYDKQPPTSQIQYYYEVNKTSMIEMIRISGYGIRGTITDAMTGEAVAAAIYVSENFPCYNDPVTGDYHKYLTPGTGYSVTAVANGYESQTISGVVVLPGGSTPVNFSLEPSDGHYAYRVAGCRIPGNNTGDEAYSPGSLGAPDGVRYSTGNSGWIIIDMQEPVLDGPGEEIKIHEGDASPEGFQCHAASTPDGPWVLLGSGSGTATFDFTPLDLPEARYVRVTDDGGGGSTGPDIGFDLDAVEVLPQPPVVFLSADCWIDDILTGNGDGRADPGESFTLNISLRNHGGLTATNTTGLLNFDTSWVVVPESGATFGDIGHGDIAVASIPMTPDPETPLETIVMTVMNISANDGAFAQAFPFNFTIGAIVEDWETNNFTKFNWSFSGAQPWVITPLNPYEGSFSAKSGNIDDFETSSIQVSLDVVGHDDITFYRKVASQGEHDFLKFYIDNKLIDQWSGSLQWEQVSYQVDPGYHVFKWTYSKDATGSTTYDCGWLDRIVFPSCNIGGSFQVLANAFPGEFCGPGSSQLGAYTVGGTGVILFDWTPEAGLDDPSVRFPVATLTDSVIYTVVVTDSQYKKDTSGVLVAVHPIPEIPVIIQEGDSLISSSPQGNQWYDLSGPVTGATDQVFHPVVETTYYVIVTSPEGCSSGPSNEIEFLFTTTPEFALEQRIRLFPNPSAGDVFAYPDGSLKGMVTVCLFDLPGHMIRSELHYFDHQASPLLIPLGEVGPGMYFLVFYDGDGHRIAATRLVRQ